MTYQLSFGGDTFFIHRLFMILEITLFMDVEWSDTTESADDS